MSNLNNSFVIVVIGMWAAEVVQCHDQAIAVDKLIKLGTPEAEPDAASKAQGLDTTSWGSDARKAACERMNTREQVIKTVERFYKHKRNQLSGETGNTYVYSLQFPGRSSGPVKAIGFKCHAAAGSYPFIVVYKEAFERYEYAAYVPEDKDFD